MSVTVSADAGDQALRPRRLGAGWLALLLIAAIASAWHNSLQGEFILDDKLAVGSNPTIRHLWPPMVVLRPPNDGQTVTGRPLLNLSFAMDWAISGRAVWSYHLTNALIHALAALVLFGVLRRTLQQPRLTSWFGGEAPLIAGTAALVWAVHPLLTESVTYVSQRAESLAALCYLTVLYGFIRGTENESRGSPVWMSLGVAACLAGMAIKETVVSVPSLVLLYDRTFVAGGFRSALRQHAVFYGGLAATWLLLFWLVIGAGDRGHTAGFGLEIDTWHYALTQCEAITHYLALAAWPARLVLDYGFGVVTSLGIVIGRSLLLVGLLFATFLALRAKRPIGLAAAAFFALLAPSSSFIPVVTQTIAEHRMYLPLAAVVIVAVTIAYVAAGRRALLGLAVASAALGVLTAHRNRDFRTAVGLWQDTIAKAPQNARAYMELGTSLLDLGRAAEAIPVIETALKLRPETPKAECNLGVALAKVGRYQESLQHFLVAANGLPGRTEPLFGIGFDLLRLGRGNEAVPWFRRVVQLTPNDAEAHSNLAILYEQIGQMAEATEEFQAAMRCDPNNAAAHFGYGNMLSHAERRSDAIAQYRIALAIDPKLVNAHLNLGALLINAGQIAEGVRETELVLQLDPHNVRAQTNLARVQNRSAAAN